MPADFARAMRLAALTWTRMDGDVIEEFVRHTARFVDHHVIVDLQSPDATRATLEALITEGFQISILHHQGVAIDYGPTMARHARRALREHGAHYLLLLDADEFIMCESRRHLETSLRSLPPGAHGKMPWTTYIPDGDEQAGVEAARPVLARIRSHRARESRVYYKVVLHRSFAESEAHRLDDGNHEAWSPAGPAVTLEGVRLGHFPVREHAQIEAKAFCGWTATIAAGHGSDEGRAFQWRAIYTRMLDNAPRRTLREIALGYLDDDGDDEVVVEPIAPAARRYTPATPGLAAVAIEISRQLAAAYARQAEASGAPAPAAELRAAPAGIPEAAGNLDEARFLDDALVEIEPGNPQRVTTGSLLVVRGWIALGRPPQAPRRIGARVGDHWYPLLPVTRPDVATAFERAELAATGFYGVLALDEIGLQHFRVDIVAEDVAGSMAALPTGIDVTIEPASLSERESAVDRMDIAVENVRILGGPVFESQEPIVVNRGDVLEIRGTARDRQTGSAATSVRALVDGCVVATGRCALRYGTLDAAHGHGVGFTVFVRTRNLASATHDLAIEAVAADGTTCETVALRPFVIT